MTKATLSSNERLEHEREAGGLSRPLNVIPDKRSAIRDPALCFMSLASGSERRSVRVDEQSMSN